MVKSFENFLKCWKLSIRVKFSNNFDFGQNLRKISILVKFSKISILVKFSKNISILIKIFESFWFIRKFRKILISVKFSKNWNYGQIFEKFRFWSNFRKFRFWSNFRKKHFDFDQNFRKFWKMSILVKFS